MDETWFIYVENGVALNVSDYPTEEQATEAATEKFIEWLQKGHITWMIEKE